MLTKVSYRERRPLVRRLRLASRNQVVGIHTHQLFGHNLPSVHTDGNIGLRDGEEFRGKGTTTTKHGYRESHCL